MTEVTPAPRPIADVARDLGISQGHLIPYGNDKTKVRLEARAALLAPWSRTGLLLKFMELRTLGARHVRSRRRASVPAP